MGAFDNFTTNIPFKANISVVSKVTNEKFAILEEKT